MPNRELQGGAGWPRQRNYGPRNYYMHILESIAAPQSPIAAYAYRQLQQWQHVLTANCSNCSICLSPIAAIAAYAYRQLLQLQHMLTRPPIHSMKWCFGRHRIGHVPRAGNCAYPWPVTRRNAAVDWVRGLGGGRGGLFGARVRTCSRAQQGPADAEHLCVRACARARVRAARVRARAWVRSCACDGRVRK